MRGVVGLGDEWGPGVEGVLRVGAGEVFEAVDVAVLVGVVEGEGVECVGGAELGDLPFGIGLIKGGFGGDPGGDEGDVLGVEDGGGEGGHAGSVEGGDAGVDHGAGNVAAEDEAVGGVVAGVVEGSVDEAGVGEGGEPSGIEVAGGGTAGEVAVGAVDVEVGAGADFEAGEGVGGRGVGPEEVGVFDGLGEVVGMGEGGELVGGGVVVEEVAVELGGVETEGEAGGGLVAGEAFVAAGVAPDLSDDGAAVGDEEGFVEAFGGDEGGVVGGGAPSVGEAVAAVAGVVFDEDAGFEAAGGGGVAADEFEVEVFDPDGSGGEGPRLLGVGLDEEVGVGYGEPTAFFGVVGPEGEVDIVGEDAGEGGEGGEVVEDAGFGEGGGEAGAALALNEAAEGSVGEAGDEDIAVAGIGAEGDGVGEAGEAGEGGGVGSVVGEGPEVAADVVGEEVVALEGGDAVAAVNDASGDGAALVGAGAVGVVEDGVDPVGETGGWGTDDGGGGDGAFSPFPTVVSAGDDEVDFFAGALADVGGVEVALERVEGDAPGVAEANGVDFGADVGGVDGSAVEGGGADEGVVGGDGVVGGGAVDGGGGGGGEAAGALVDVDAEDGGEEAAVDALSVVEVVVALAFVAGGEVEVAVGSEVEVATVVVVGAVELGDEDLFGVGVDEVGVREGGLEAGEADVEAVAEGGGGGDGVVDVKEAVGGVAGVEVEAEESTFASLVHNGGDVEEGGEVGVGEVGDDADASGAFGDEEAVGFSGRGADAHGGVEVEGEGVFEDEGSEGFGGRGGGEVDGEVGDAAGEADLGAGLKGGEAVKV